MVRSIKRSTRRTGRTTPATATACSHNATRLPTRGRAHRTAPTVLIAASIWAAISTRSVLRVFHLMIQSTCGSPGRFVRWFIDSRQPISAAELKPESSRASSGALGPAALSRWASGITRSRLSSVCLAECCVPGRSDNSMQNPCEPMYDASGQYPSTPA